MGVLVNLATKQVIVSRLTAVSGYLKTYATTTAAMVELQPLSPEKAAMYEGATGKTFRCYADPSCDIREHDRLREIATGNLFEVKTGGVSRRVSPGGSVDFLAITVEQLN